MKRFKNNEQLSSADQSVSLVGGEFNSAVKAMQLDSSGLLSISTDIDSATLDSASKPTLGLSTSSVAAFSTPGSGNPVTLLSSNSNRRAFYLYHDMVSTTAYIKFGSAASSTDYSLILDQPGEFFYMPFPCYTGIVTARFVGSLNLSRLYVTSLSE